MRRKNLKWPDLIPKLKKQKNTIHKKKNFKLENKKNTHTYTKLSGWLAD